VSRFLIVLGIQLFEHLSIIGTDAHISVGDLVG
jgi:hypothetical protein